MKIALAADHRGFGLKERIRELLGEVGHEAVDFGTDSEGSVDYPRFAIKAAESVARGECERGIFICGTGIGMSIAANKVKGVFAARCCSVRDAEMSRRHNNANVMAISGEMDPGLAGEMVRVFLSTEFEGGRHARRTGEITRYENMDRKV